MSPPAPHKTCGFAGNPAVVPQTVRTKLMSVASKKQVFEVSDGRMTRRKTQKNKILFKDFFLIKNKRREIYLNLSLFLFFYFVRFSFCVILSSESAKNWGSLNTFLPYRVKALRWFFPRFPAFLPLVRRRKGRRRRKFPPVFLLFLQAGGRI